jgi:hypothetical protein
MLNVPTEESAIVTVANAIVFQVTKAKVAKELLAQMIAPVTVVAHISKIFRTRPFLKIISTEISKRSCQRHLSIINGMERKPEVVSVMLSMVMLIARRECANMVPM